MTKVVGNPLLGEIPVEETKPQLSIAQRGEMVTVEFLLDISGARQFPLSRRMAYRFDKQNNVKSMVRQDAETLIRRYGNQAFRIVLDRD